MALPDHIDKNSTIWGNVKECVIFLDNGIQKVFSSNGTRGQLTVNVLNHHVRDSGFVEAVLKNYKEADGLSELSAICGFNSTKTFTRYFRRIFNTTPKQWILEMKKEEMIAKLKDTNLSLKQIADQLRFANVSYLSGFCLRKTGKRPEEIRNNQ